MEVRSRTEKGGRRRCGDAGEELAVGNEIGTWKRWEGGQLGVSEAR